MNQCIRGKSSMEEKSCNWLFLFSNILTDITKDMPVYSQETFGPVFSVFKCSNIEQMLDLANDTDFGLGGSIWSEDQEKSFFGP